MINVAVVGTGNISVMHIEAYLRFPERCRIVAMVDIVPEKARRAREKYGLDCDVFDDHRDILPLSDIDLVSVCTPPSCHAEITVNLLLGGKSVICEKPMAASLEECDAMLEAMKESGKLLSIIAQNRFRKPIRDLQRLLSSGIAGPVRHASVNSLWWRGHSYYDLWWRGTWEKEGGGCTLNHAVHHIDMLIWMMGMPESVTGVLANTAHDNAEVEDLSISILKYPGALAQLTASVVDHGEEQTLTFQCERAKLSAPMDCVASISLPNGFPQKDAGLEARVKAFADSLPELLNEVHAGQVDDVLTALETGGEPSITGMDGRRTIELITAIYKSGSTGQAVELPISRDDAFYTVDGIMKSVPHFYKKSKSVGDLDGNITFGADYKI